MTRTALKHPVPEFDAFGVFDALMESVLITDANLTPPGPEIIYANPSFERMTGWSVPELVGKSPRVLQGPATDTDIFAKMHAALADGRCWQGRAVNYRKDGSEYVVEWSIAPIRAPDGKVVNYVALQRDVTEHVKIEDDLNAALAARHEADQTKLDFLAIMNHELRTPLNVIIGFAEILQKKLERSGAEAQTAEYVELILDSGKKLLAMVTDILEFTRFPRRGEGGVFADLEVGDVIRRCLDIVEAGAKEKSVTIVSGDLTGMPMCAYEPSLRKVFTHILDNAIKFSPAGGRVTLVCSVQGDEIHVTVADEGPGIPRDYLDKIFSPFAQAESSLNRSHEGMGLGLAIAQRLAHFHGGRIEVETAPDRGTCVHVFLPVSKTGRTCSPAG